MSRRRIQLGSGLELAKLVATLQDMLAMNTRPALICDLAEIEHGWIYLRPRMGKHDPDTERYTIIGWDLKYGYPSTGDPELVLKEAVRVTAILVDWEPLLFAHIYLEPDMALEQIAEIILLIVTKVQAIRHPELMRMALE